MRQSLLTQEPKAVELKTDLIELVQSGFAGDRCAGFIVELSHFFLKISWFKDVDVRVPVELLLMGKIFAVGGIKALIKETCFVPAQMVDQKG